VGLAGGVANDVGQVTTGRLTETLVLMPAEGSLSLSGRLRWLSSSVRSSDAPVPWSTTGRKVCWIGTNWQGKGHRPPMPPPRSLPPPRAHTGGFALDSEVPRAPASRPDRAHRRRGRRPHRADKVRFRIRSRARVVAPADRSGCLTAVGSMAPRAGPAVGGGASSEEKVVRSRPPALVR